jgi:hypothetical protein
MASEILKILLFLLDDIVMLGTKGIVKYHHPSPLFRWHHIPRSVP